MLGSPLIDSPLRIYARFDFNFKGVPQIAVLDVCPQRPVLIPHILGGTVSLWPVQLRFSVRGFRSKMYSILLIGMSPNKLSVLNLRLTINIVP